MPRVGLDLLMTLAILFGQLVGRHELTVLLDQAAIAMFTGQGRVDLEDLDLFALQTSRRVELLLDAPLGEHETALTLLVRRKARFHLRRKRLVVREWRILCDRSSKQQQNDESRTHARIIPPRACRARLLMGITKLAAMES